jgi:hypothetical protein
MTQRLFCHHGHQWKISDDLTGEELVCRRCGSVTTVQALVAKDNVLPGIANSRAKTDEGGDESPSKCTPLFSAAGRCNDIDYTSPRDSSQAQRFSMRSPPCLRDRQ